MSMAKPKVDNQGEKTVIKFDPRKSSDCTVDITFTQHQLQSLKQTSPDSGLFHLWDLLPEDAPKPVMEYEVITSADPLQAKMETLIYSQSNIPNISIDQDMVQYIESMTVGQKNNQLWIDLHKGRITSSLFGSVLKARNPPADSLLKQILEGSNLDQYSCLPPAVKWGVDHEEKARKEYIFHKSCQVYSVEVKPTGLTVSNTHAFLGASSDGKVIENGEEGVLEIKCPYSKKSQHVNNMKIDDIMNLDEPFSFCLEMHNFEPRLKRNHPYYAQVQEEMSLMGLPWCDFVLWTAAQSNNIFIERIIFDPEFVMQLLPKLVAFYVEYVNPRMLKAQQS